MKHRSFLLMLMIVLLASLACGLPWTPAVETPPPGEAEITRQVEPEPTQEVVTLPVEEPTAEPTDEPPVQPTVEPTEEPSTCSAAMVTASAFNVEFCYPDQYSQGFMQVMLPAEPPTADLPIWGFHPDMIEITLAGYPVENAYHDPVVRIYPLDELIALDPLYQNLVTELQALLASQNPNPDSIPFVPVFNAAQILRAQVAYINFRGGSGVRFVTHYSQAAAPISNDSAFYAFIGLTDDGAHLISAVMPVNHPLFYPDVYTEPAEGWETFANNFEAYLSNIEGELDAQSPDAFYPVLLPLDEMMASFLIPPDAIP